MTAAAGAESAVTTPDRGPVAPLVSVAGIWKSYQGDRDAEPLRVLRGVSLNVRPGEFVALMGASGSGKSTLLNLVGGLDTADEGRIIVAGAELQAMSDDERSEFRLRAIGFVFQFFNLLPNLTVVENIAMPLLLAGAGTTEAADAARRLAREVGLEERLGHAAHQLSGGEMQRVALARALVHRPQLLLADEPTGNLDSRTGASILRMIRELARSHGASIIMATHDAHAAAEADRVLTMMDGELVDGT